MEHWINDRLHLSENLFSEIDIFSMDYAAWLYKLPPRMRMAVEFRSEGYTQEEIATMMKITQQTVSDYLNKAKLKFMDYFHGYMPVSEEIRPFER